MFNRSPSRPLDAEGAGAAPNTESPRARLGEGCVGGAAPKKELDGMGEGCLGGVGVGGAGAPRPMSSNWASLPLPEERSSPAGVTWPPEMVPFAVVVVVPKSNRTDEFAGC